MTIEEAIYHCEEKEKEQKYYANTERNGLMIQSCLHCAEEHRQLAEWLKELKELREEQEKRRWIPVSEKLPECPCIICDDLGQVRQILSFITLTRKDGSIYYVDGDMFSSIIERGWIPETRIIAWQPLPPIFKGE